MKITDILLLYCALFISITLHTTEPAHNPILVAVIMVKNEEAVIEKTLQPFVDGGVTDFFVFDTGSTDNTIAITQEFFTKNAISHGYIEEEPFIDFATSRNHALERAQKRFPNAAFIIMFDAEWYINDAHALIEFCHKCLMEHDVYATYDIRILNRAIDFYTPRLIRCGRGSYFEGVVHEIIVGQRDIKIPPTIYFQYLPTAQGTAKSQERFMRDRQLLYIEHIKNPECTRTLFYLARACEDIGNLEEAYTFYKKRITMVGWDEEDFMSYYRLAQTIEKLSYHDSRYTWAEALDYYLKAYTMRPHRAEPLISIAYYYVQQNDMPTAFLFAHRACEIAYPYNDVLFVQKYAYDYLRYELLARCAWHTKEWNIGEDAARKAFEAHPEYVHAYNNLQCFLERSHNARIIHS